MATEIQDNPLIVDLKDSYGCLLIGIFLSCVLYGASSLQAFIYFSRYWDTDSVKRKAFVAFVWLVDTANQCLVMQSVWPALIHRYGSLMEVGTIQPAITHHAWVSQLVAFCVQLFFIYRLWIFSHRNWFFAVPMFIMSLFQIVVVIPYNIIMQVFVFFVSQGQSNSQIAAHWATSVVMALRSVTAGEDVILACGMILLVLKDGMPEYRSTRRMMSRLIFLTANTGFWSAAVAIVEISLVNLSLLTTAHNFAHKLGCQVASFPSGIQFLVVEIPLCNIYVNTLLANLNAREYVRGDDFTEYNSTPSRLTARTGSGNNTSGGSNIYLGRLGSAKSGSQQIESPMVKIEAMAASDAGKKSQETELRPQRSFDGDQAV
ncbi:hypothetical protein VNI00_001203 [Paramarasmius palmivorus]|uniref:DUF6534 domain-containing protein n=1 Tax=Paramarasmius palmivorus TaxID=297713 RepID=A0AAW0E5J2_9AGAR